LQWLQFVKNIQNTSEDQFTVLLYPFDKSDVEVKFEKRENGNIRVITGDYIDEIYFMNQNQKNSDFDSDARAVFIRKKNGEVVNSCMIDGRYLKYEKKDLFRSDVKSNYEK
jgi:hypothetical protein